MVKPNKNMVDLFKRAKELVYKFDDVVQQEVTDDDFIGIFYSENWAPLFKEEFKSLSLDESIYINAYCLFLNVLLKLVETEFKTLEVKLYTRNYSQYFYYDGFIYDMSSVERLHEPPTETLPPSKWLISMSEREKEIYKLILKELKAQ